MFLKNEKEKSIKKLAQIKSYIRTFPEFESAYLQLKEEYRKKANPICDSLELTLDGKPLYYQEELIYTRLENDFLLIACDDFKMLIYELKECDVEWVRHITEPEWLEEYNRKEKEKEK